MRDEHGAPAETDGTAVPPGHTTNPSAWRHRLPVAAVALIGFAISTYLALYQYEVLDRVWDPLFGDGSRKVLTSSLSRALPVRDAALGAAAYLAEAAIELSGGRRRWRDRPWLVLLTGAVAAALVLTGLALTVAQPLLTGTFCTLCLASAAASLVIAALLVREVRAALTETLRHRRAGHGWWAAVKGGHRNA